MNGKERIVAALQRQPVDRTPVWFMRQAGRHLPEYRKLAAEHSFWERCKDLDLCTTITMQPLQRYDALGNEQPVPERPHTHDVPDADVHALQRRLPALLRYRLCHGG